ncbi:MAG: hypothetical protein K0Q59_2450, partial [Paenibacillus sp.]|nr:hypothetical protein [Paenibacillus sp.]
LDFLLFGNVPTLGVVLCGMLLITATVTASFKKREREPTVGA